MAANSRKKGAKDSKHSLQEALDECHDLLQKMKKPKRKSRFNFFRDPLTGRRKSHYPYKPRFQDEHVPCTSSNDDIDQSLLGEVDDVGHEMPSTSSVEEDDLETTIVRCEEVLATFPSTSRNWETRMTSLTSSWDSARKQLIEAVLTCEGLPSPDCCSICLEGKVGIRCIECPIQFMCSSCDEKVHNCLPFHDRDAYVNGYFHAIPPTVGVDEEDCTQIIGIYMLIVNSFPVPNIPDHCSSCKETGFIKQLPSPGFLIIVNEK
ncbi:unnamed protein product, partial [Pocillopora meandrina]